MLIAPIALLISSCDFFVDAAIDCIDNDEPRLSPNLLPNPILNQTYSEVVQVSIQNEPRDDLFDYQFTLTGALPEGMQTEIAPREIRVFGTPIELGDFNFSVRVDVLDNPGRFGDTSGLCSTVDVNNYEWTIQAM